MQPSLSWIYWLAVYVGSLVGMSSENILATVYEDTPALHVEICARLNLQFPMSPERARGLAHFAHRIQWVI